MKDLLYRGTIEILSGAIRHIGRNQKTNEWTDGSYCDPSVGLADAFLRKALWTVEYEYRDWKKTEGLPPVVVNEKACPRCGCRITKEFGDCPAGNWWTGCAGCGLRCSLW